MNASPGGPPPPAQPALPWSRGRLRGAAVAAAGVAALLLYGLVFGLSRFLTTVGEAGTPRDAAAADAMAGSSPQRRRDAAAAAPMHRVDPAAARPVAPATVQAATIVVPAATTAGPAGVPSGFPQTPEGAVGQLAAIDTTVLTAMAMDIARTVHRAWSAPGAVPFGDWEPARSVRAFLAGSRLADPAQRAVVTVTPAAAQIKAHDGPDWVVACVLHRVRAVVKTDAEVGFGHCERMTWQTGRWIIAAGPAPARAPSTWPGSDTAAAAGWRTWVGSEDLP